MGGIAFIALKTQKNRLEGRLIGGRRQRSGNNPALACLFADEIVPIDTPLESLA